MSEQQPPSPQHFNSQIYPETVRLEREGYLGLSPKQVYRREAAFALRAAGVKGPENFREGEGIVDTACGVGNHAFQMSDMLERKVPIEGVDVAGKLIEIANERLQKRIQQGIHDRIAQFTEGAMQGLEKKKLSGRNVRLITNLGSSFFGYMGVGQMKESLLHFYNLLEPGGQLVIQWRGDDPDETQKQWEEREARIRGKRKKFSVSKSQENVAGYPMPLDMVENYDKTSSCYLRYIDAENPAVVDGDSAAEVAKYEPFTKVIDGRPCKGWEHTTSGIQFLSYERVYRDAQGKETVLPPTLIAKMKEEKEDNDRPKGSPPKEFDGMKKLLRETWFRDDANAADRNVRFVRGEGEEEHLGHQVLNALVATKPG
ncbi:MAG: class I SAM-dependent methyltransferase [Candidatus Peribacteraceae bacterium]|jgi:hypothetical protein